MNELSTNHFFLQKGVWEGEGMITFSMAEDELIFSSIWRVEAEEGGRITIFQEVDVKESPNKMKNSFVITNLEPFSFDISLENELIGKVEGKGVIDNRLIAWEFRNTDEGFEGFEIYEKVAEDAYTLQAQFSAGEGLRTFIKGKLKKIS